LTLRGRFCGTRAPCSDDGFGSIAWLGREANAQAEKAEIKGLSQEKNGGDAFMLLMLFRAEHTARVLRGETFEINVKAMAKCKSLCWSARRFRNARDVLLATGHIKITEPGRNCRTGRLATQYTFGSSPRGIG
jgi:hypothetical protein